MGKKGMEMAAAGSSLPAEVVTERAMSTLEELPVEVLISRRKKIKEVMKRVMEIGVHYGKIPGCGDKPTLLKPGAEMLCCTFRLDPQYESTPFSVALASDGHLDLKSVCTLYHIPTGQRLGSGEGACSTRETKYVFRKGARVCPTCGKETIIKGREEFGGGWLCFAKKGGCGAKFADDAEEIVGQKTGNVANDNLADCYNTVLKMSNKRALLAAVLNVTGASDTFTQDLDDEDMRGAAAGDGYKEPPSPAAKAANPAPKASNSPKTGGNGAPATANGSAIKKTGAIGEPYTCNGALQHKGYEIAQVRAIVMEVRERKTKTQKIISTYLCADSDDGKNPIMISLWGAAHPAVMKGAEVDFFSVVVKEWNGRIEADAKKIVPLVNEDPNFDDGFNANEIRDDLRT